TNSPLRSNRAEDGGGLYLPGTSAPSLIRSCTITDNAAAGGGGLFGVNTQAVIIQNSTISGNTATRDNGGGISIRIFSPWTIQNCTIAFNRCRNSGGGIFLRDNAAVFLESTIVSLNSAPNGPDLFSMSGADTFTINFSLTATLSGASAVLDQTSQGLVGMDPLLAPLVNNGGPTQTHALKKGSPCINMGSNPANLTTDQRGGLFKRKLGIQVDIGAYERQ